MAKEQDFKLFFSLDYSGDGHWPKDQVVKILSNYSAHEAYYRHDDGRALVSTFEGFQSAGDWADIKKKVGKSVGNDTCCYFVPSWASAGVAKASMVAAIDGLMSWDAWPYGNMEMNMTEDKQFMDALEHEGKSYIMPVSPWFYTNLRQFNKNWVWQGDGLWPQRWQQVIELQPEYVEILTWNDYGESHYIGPLREKATGVLESAGAPFDYVSGMPHDGWRTMLPYWISQYKAGAGQDASQDTSQAAEIGDEVLSVWYRVSAANACGDGKTVGNSKSQGQTLLKPGEVLEDKVFYSALLEGSADVKVSIGGENRTAEWTDVPDGGRGVYTGAIPFDKHTGEVVVTLTRDGDLLAQMKGREIVGSCPGNLTNWNAWVGNATAVRANRAPGADGDDSAGVSLQSPLWLLGLGLVFSLLI